MLRGFAALVALLVYSFAFGAPEPALRSGAFDPPRVAPDFKLRGSDGKDLNLSQFKGKVVALGFGYSSCPDICPTTLFYLAQAKEKLGAAGKDFQIVYVTVDPERDSVERLHKYLSSYDKTFIGGTGTPEKLAAVQKDYGIQVARQPPLAGKPSMYFIHHSSFVYLIDRDGKIRAMMPYGTSPEDMAHDAKVLLGK